MPGLAKTDQIEPIPTLTKPVLEPTDGNIDEKISQVSPQIPLQHPEDTYKGIPIDCFRAFNIPLESVSAKEISELRDIVSWVKEHGVSNTSEIISEIMKLRSELGTPSGDERAYNKVWRFIKLQKVIENSLKG